MDELTIIACMRKYLDDAGHAIQDGDRQRAINHLQDLKTCIETLQGICRLPSECQQGIAEIWQ